MNTLNTKLSDSAFIIHFIIKILQISSNILSNKIHLTTDSALTKTSLYSFYKINKTNKTNSERTVVRHNYKSNLKTQLIVRRIDLITILI